MGWEGQHEVVERFCEKNGIYTVLSSRKYISYREWLCD